MSKIDFKKELKHLYRPSAKKFAVVDVPPLQFLMLDGHGDPNTAQEYKDALEALYAVSYKLKFMRKKELGKDYVVPAPGGAVVGRGYGNVHHPKRQKRLGVDDDDHAAGVDQPGNV